MADNPDDKPTGPARVDSYREGSSANGVLHLAGNVWGIAEDPRTPSTEALEHFQKVLNPPPSSLVRNPGIPSVAVGPVPDLPHAVNVEFASIPARLADPSIGFRCVKIPNAGSKASSG
ncbi:MAG: hypothetical protein U5J83_01060 [Bryobacterales bacterium]|nr:hypothetical protein [Bryobacterales bacterium]